MLIFTNICHFDFFFKTKKEIQVKNENYYSIETKALTKKIKKNCLARSSMEN